jgi:hypothetical protein
MITAFNAALQTLNVADSMSPTAILIAKSIVDVAKRGERDPARLYEKGLGPCIPPGSSNPLGPRNPVEEKKPSDQTKAVRRAKALGRTKASARTKALGRRKASARTKTAARPIS